MHRSRPCRGPRRWLVAGSLACALSSCGLPDHGVTRVDDATVPYRLLETAGPAP